MSVINRMLRDLEARRGSSTAEGASAAVRATPAAAPRRQLWLLLLGGSAAISAAAFGDWPATFSKPAHQPTPVAIVDVAAAAPVSALVAAEPVPLPAPSIEPRAAAPPATRVAVATTHSRRAAITLPAAPRTMPRDALAAPPETGSVDKRLLAQPAVQRALGLYQQALDLAATGHGRAALEKLHEALDLDPGLLSARLHAATLWIELGQPAQAETLALQGLAVAPNEPQLTYLLARVLADRGDAAGAIARLDSGTRLSAEAFGLRAGLLAQRGEFERALHDYEQAVKAQPGNSLWWLGLGVALEAAGHPPQARQAYARAQSVGIGRHDLNLFVDQKLVALEGAK